MKVHVGETELWPVYWFRPAKSDSDYEQTCSIEADEVMLERWREAREAFDKAQAEIGSLVRKAGILK